jgi:hypothetical protein
VTKPIKDIAASVRARLLQNSKEQGKTFDEVMTLYMLERFLYRLSLSQYREQFILKGGLLLCVLFNDRSRTTKDADFLARHLVSQLDNIGDIFKMICSVQCNDGLIFNSDTLQTVRIKEDADYEGVRVNILCYMGQAKKVLQIDIGFGDVIVPKPQVMRYPSLLGMECPEILTYSIESVIAEKFEAMISLAGMNSRMKDFFDIYSLSGQFDLDGRIVYQAIFETFQRRGTVYNKNAYVFTDEFKILPEKQLQWKAYLKRSVHQDLKFEKVIDAVKTFLLPVYESLVMDKEFFGNWSSRQGIWITAGMRGAE